jgi:hypothetical protein
MKTFLLNKRNGENKGFKIDFDAGRSLTICDEIVHQFPRTKDAKEITLRVDNKPFFKGVKVLVTPHLFWHWESEVLHSSNMPFGYFEGTESVITDTMTELGLPKGGEIYVRLSPTTVSDKRMILAQDVIAQLASGKFVGVTDFAISWPTKRALYMAQKRVNGVSNDENLSEQLRTASCQTALRTVPVCEVCAKGALFLAYVGRFNNVTLNEVYNAHSDGSMGTAIEKNPRLTETFGTVLINEIEYVYEGRLFDWNEMSFERQARLEKWRAKVKAEYTATLQREQLGFNFTSQNKFMMTAIMQQIVRNRGQRLL